MAAAKASESEVREGSGEQPTAKAELAARQGRPSSGQVLAARYRLEAQLGRGGMGEVWRAEHLLTGRRVAVKLLRNALLHDPDMRRRFLREARVASAVNHPNVVEVLDAFELEDGTPALVMPLLEGETLASLLSREGPLSFAALNDVLVPLVSAVMTAHERHVVHRDLKPDNVFLARDGNATVVKVLDFGIAKLLADEEGADSTITGTGTLIGTPCYMAPEQAFGERDQDHRVDIYAIGVVAYEALSGCRPVEGENIGHVVKALLTQATTPLAVVAPQVPARVSALVMRLLARDKAQRPQTLAEVLAELLELEGDTGAPASGGPVERPERPPPSGSTLVSPREAGVPRKRLEPAAVVVNPTPVEHAITQPVNQPARRSPWLVVGALMVLGLLGTLALREPRQPASDVSSATAAPAPSLAPPATTLSENQAVSAVAIPSASPGASAMPHAAGRAPKARPPIGEAVVKTQSGPSLKPTPSAAKRPEGLQEEPPF